MPRGADSGTGDPFIPPSHCSARSRAGRAIRCDPQCITSLASGVTLEFGRYFILDNSCAHRACSSALNRIRWRAIFLHRAFQRLYRNRLTLHPPPPGVPAPLPKSVDPPPTSTGGGKSQPLAEQVRAGRRQLWRSKYKLL